MTKEADTIIGLYRRHGAKWAKLRSQSPFLEFGWIDRFLKLLPTNPSILDLGCGSGTPIARHLSENGCAVTGIDTSPELIEIAKEQGIDAEWLLADMRTLALGKTFHGIMAWNSFFHLTPDDQRAMFSVFIRHTTKGSALMFTSGPTCGTSTGELEGEPLYHASLDGEEYRALLSENHFEVIENIVEDPECGHHTVWLAQRFD